MKNIKYSKKDLIKDVTKEAIALKQNATKAEINRLDFSSLDPEDHCGCIYGQMTGDCRSSRASALIFKSCKRFIDFTSASKIRTLKDVRENVNGETINGVNSDKDFLRTRDNGDIKYFSTIESYILMPFAKNNNLVAFLKGETDALNL